MASTEPGVAGAEVVVEKLAELTPDALAMLGELVVHSGWNQTPQDWGVFCSCGTIYVVRDEQGRIAASGAVLPMGESRPGALASLTGRGVAWISMILVRPDRRGKQLAMEIIRGLEAWAVELGYTRMILEHGNLQPEAAALYERAGFAVIPSTHRSRSTMHALRSDCVPSSSR